MIGMNKPEVSIIVPVYNVEQYIDECIESILMQSFNAFEVLLINDGSTDQSLEHLKLYEKKDIRVRVIEQKNSGVAAARNRGIDLSKADFIMFVDADDWIEHDTVKLLYNTIMRDRSDIVICGLKQRFKNGEVERPVVTEQKILNFSEMAEYASNGDVVGSSVNKLYRRSLIADIRYPDLSMAEDIVFNRQLLSSCRKITLIPELLYQNRQRASSACHRKNNYKSVAAICRAVQLIAKTEVTDNIAEQNMWNEVAACLLYDALQAILIQNDDIELLIFLTKQPFFWKIIRDKKMPSFHQTFKMKILLFLLKCRLYKFTLQISRRYKDKVEQKQYVIRECFE